MKHSLPQLPQHVSSDGREIWDWAAQLGQFAARADRLRQLRADLNECGQRCGDCFKMLQDKEYIDAAIRTIEALPRYADTGAPMLWGSTVWIGPDDSHVGVVCEVHQNHIVLQRPSGKVGFAPDECFSTRQTAEQAIAERGEAEG